MTSKSVCMDSPLKYFFAYEYPNVPATFAQGILLLPHTPGLACILV